MSNIAGFCLTNNIDYPHFITIGTQGAGKSTLFNRLFNQYVKLPVRKTIEENITAKTRVPILLECKHSDIENVFVNTYNDNNIITCNTEFNNTNDIEKKISELHKILEDNASFAIDSMIHICIHAKQCNINLLGIDFPGINYSNNSDVLLNKYKSHLLSHPSIIALLVVDENPENIEGLKILQDCGVQNNNIIICFTKSDLPDRKIEYPLIITKYQNLGFNVCIIKNPDLTKMTNQNIDFDKEENIFFTTEYTNYKNICGISKLKQMITERLTYTQTQKLSIINKFKQYNDYLTNQILFTKIDDNKDKHKIFIHFKQNIITYLSQYHDNIIYANDINDIQLEFNNMQDLIYNYIVEHIYNLYYFLSEKSIKSIIDKIFIDYNISDYKIICEFTDNFTNLGKKHNIYRYKSCHNNIKKIALIN